LDDISSVLAISDFCVRARSLRGTPRQRPDAFGVAITPHVAAVDVNLTVPFDRRLITFDTLLIELLQKVLIFQAPQAVHCTHGRAVVRRAERQVDPARLEKGCDAVLSRPPVHVAAIVVVNVDGTKGSPVSADRCSRNWSNSLFHAAACTRAVLVSTPSRSNRIAS
jgi:hypothetical protein